MRRATVSRGHFHPDEKERRRSQDPCAILRGVGLAAGMTFVDMGCGEGFFSIPAAEIVGKSGRVYAVDSDPASIEKLAGRLSGSGVNVTVKAARAEETILFDAGADMIFFANAFHDFEDKAKVLANSFRMLKTGGRVVDLDWDRVNTVHGPPLWKRVPAAEAERLISEAGLEVAEVRALGRHHYIITAEKG